MKLTVGQKDPGLVEKFHNLLNLTRDLQSVVAENSGIFTRGHLVV